MSDIERPFTITHVVHTGITVSSLQDALHFWVDVLGFRLVSCERFGRGAFLDNLVGVKDAALTLAVIEAPGHLIELLEYHSPSDRQIMKPRACDVGSFHIGFMVNDLNAVLNRVEPLGWHRLGTPQMVQNGAEAGTRLVYVRGPDGITIEFFELPSKDGDREENSLGA